MAKRAREQAVKEKRERKQAKKAEVAAARAAAKNGQPNEPGAGDETTPEPEQGPPGAPSDQP